MTDSGRIIPVPPDRERSPDMAVREHRKGFWFFSPLTNEAEQWTRENVSNDEKQWSGRAVMVANSAINDCVIDARAAGFKVAIRRLK